MYRKKEGLRFKTVVGIKPKMYDFGCREAPKLTWFPQDNICYHATAYTGSIFPGFEPLSKVSISFYYILLCIKSSVRYTGWLGPIIDIHVSIPNSNENNYFPLLSIERN